MTFSCHPLIHCHVLQNTKNCSRMRGELGSTRQWYLSNMCTHNIPLFTKLWSHIISQVEHVQLWWKRKDEHANDQDLSQVHIQKIDIEQLKVSKFWIWAMNSLNIQQYQKKKTNYHQYWSSSKVVCTWMHCNLFKKTL